MKNIKIRRTGMYISASACMLTFLTGCPQSRVYPLSSLPEDVNTTYNVNLNVENSVTRSSYMGGDAEIKPNEILKNCDFDVYIDNTTGCFLGYLKAYENDKNDIGYQMFAKTMLSFKDTFDCTKSYRTHTLQPNENAVLGWDEYTQNVFSNFANTNVYTEHTNSVFADDDAPIKMWLSDVEKKIGSSSNTTYVYLSDLNEQNGILSTMGSKVKDILNTHPDKDFLIISYVLPYKGDISSPTFGNEGNSQSQVETKHFDEPVDRNYYSLVFGDSEILSALRQKVKEGFSDINLPMNSYTYRELFYSEKEITTNNKIGNIIENNDYHITNAPKINIVDKNGNIISEDSFNSNLNIMENESEDSLFGSVGSNDEAIGRILQNLDLSTAYTNYFIESPKTNTYMFLNSIPNQGDVSSDVSLKLENSDVYDFDIENASIYTYVPEQGGNSFEDDSSGNGWLLQNTNKGTDWETNLTNDTINLKLSKILPIDTMPCIVVSVPIKIVYTKTVTDSNVIELTPEFREWINSNKVPDIITDANETERYTKTYGFDSFIDKITGYKSLPDGSADKIIKDQAVEEYSEEISRVNLIIIAKEE